MTSHSDKLISGIQYTCECGRKFMDQNTLDQHIDYAHNNACIIGKNIQVINDNNYKPEIVFDEWENRTIPILISLPTLPLFTKRKVKKIYEPRHIEIKKTMTQWGANQIQKKIKIINEIIGDDEELQDALKKYWGWTDREDW